MKNVGIFSVLFVSCLIQSNAWALNLKFIGETTIATGTKYQNTNVGGLSGIVWSPQKLLALSDDKGGDGSPRFYEFDLKIDKKNVQLIPKGVHIITGLPDNLQEKGGLDPEGLVSLPNGDLLISSEGNLDAKPRVVPKIFTVSSEGQWKSDLPLPAKFLPELTGLQKTGVQLNGAFEGLSMDPGGQFLFAGTELPLMQDVSVQMPEKGAWLRIVRFENKGTPKTFQPTTEYAYPMDPYSSNKMGTEIFRGVSEILAISENKLLVLERGLRVSLKNLKTPALTLYLVDLSTGSDVSSLRSLADGKFTGLKKTKILDFEVDLEKECGEKCIENFEALSWGPKLEDGRRSLLVMSDNNFSKSQITRFLVFAVEGE